MEGTQFILTLLGLRRMKRLIWFLLYGFSLLVSPANAQSTDATLSGGVTDPTGTFIVDAEIDIANDTTGVVYTTKTNGSGIYYLSILPPGHYHVQVSKIGFKTLIKPDVVLNVQSALSLNFSLPVGATSESITVDAGTSSINTSDASVSTVVDRKFVENLPLNGRSFQDLISMTPGVVTQSPQNTSAQGAGQAGDFSVNGQRTESNYYLVDGVSGNVSSGSPSASTQAANSGSIAATTALGTTQGLLSVDALQEFRVLSSTYSAEYGRTPGGQFSFVTRSGTNAFHGTVFDYLRNSFFDANDWFNDYYGKPIAPLRQNDFGGATGGPVWIPKLYNGKEKTFFFGSYEGLRLTQPQAATIQYVPDTFMRQQAPSTLQPILNAFPLPSLGGIDYGTAASPSLAQFIQSYSLPGQINSTSVRVDQSLSQNFKLFFRIGDTTSFSSTRNLSSLLENHIDTQTYTWGLDGQIVRNLTNEFRAGYSRGTSKGAQALDGFAGAQPLNLAASLGADTIASAGFFETFIPSVGYSYLETGLVDNLSRQWNIIDSLSMNLGHHFIKLGVDYRRITAPLNPSENPLAEFIYESEQAVQTNSAQLAVALRQEGATPIFNETAAFAQDEWRLTKRVNLSLGLRWEIDPPPTEENGNDAFTLLGNIGTPSTLTLAPRGTPLWKTTWYNFAPRLGVAWRAHDAPGWETVFRAGGGVFFDADNQLAVGGFQALGFSAENLFFGASAPFTSSQLDFSPSVTPPYTSASIYAFPDHLQLPYSLEWNVSTEQAIGKAQSLTLSYVGSNGRRLIQQQELSLTSLNPNFGNVYYIQNGITSSYNALQVKFQRSVAHGVQALASYTWAHSLDFGSNDATLPVERGNADFDVRNNFQGGLSMELPSMRWNQFNDAILNHWGLDARFLARSAFPITLNGSTLVDPATGSLYNGNVNLIPGRPLYLYGPQYPGGRALNGGPSTTSATAAFIVPVGTAVGDAPRNLVRGFDETQLNFAARRVFAIHGNLALQFRAEAFNILNHPNFGYVDPVLTDAQFGQATQMLNQSLATVASQYQQGGSRSMQFALKFIF
jgi:hypothetical protein